MPVQLFEVRNSRDSLANSHRGEVAEIYDK
jgi:hypothetical protein